MSKSEARTAITPAIGAIQKTSGLTEDDDATANACMGMNMVSNRCPFCIYVFLKFIGDINVKSEFCFNQKQKYVFRFGCIFKQVKPISNKSETYKGLRDGFKINSG
jgi:hypothetical protein